jgi:hypothetical protein
MWYYKLVALYKYATSFIKSDWELGDYPIRIRYQDKNTPNIGDFQVVPCLAYIFNWDTIFGGGNTKAEALSQLKQNFDNYKKQHNSIPRPGTRFPLQLSLTGEEIKHLGSFQKYVPVANMFLHSIGFTGEVFFISDKSSLMDVFFDCDDLSLIYERIEEVYGVDVSDIPYGNLIQILNRLKEQLPDQS